MSKLPFAIDPRCYAEHIGQIWAIEPGWFADAVCRVNQGVLRPQAAVQEAEDTSPPYVVTEDGIAVLGINGHMSKGRSKFGGTSTVETRRALRDIADDPRAKGALLVVDSPGGAVPGTEALAGEVARLAKKIPVHAYVDGLGASAAYWVASQASRISATATSEIGSIGVLSVLVDDSEANAREGIKTVVLSSGPFKGSGIPPVSAEQLEYLSERVRDIADEFRAAVSRGRGGVYEEWMSGKVWIAKKAKDLGLIDSIENLEGALMGVRNAIPREASVAIQANRRGQITRAMLHMAKHEIQSGP
jgi:signal peptide peptidase SppA